ncbi:hypothetical protein [Chitinimonas lacunae]|uniref:Uncharacterized protein n=1 Tax=Chitinimonas lacunae TaxID=1963018 RepID=A0ABV8MLT2_9NEIS
MADRILKAGTDSISVARQVAEAFGVPLGSILDDALEGAARIRAKILVGRDGRRSMTLTVCIEPHPEIPASDDELIVRTKDGQFWLEPFGDGPIEPVYRLRWIEGAGELDPRRNCTVVICAESRTCAEIVAKFLSQHHFTASVRAKHELPESPGADAVIVQGYHADEIAMPIRAAAGRVVPVIALHDSEMPDNPAQRIFYARPAGIAVLLKLHEIVRFSPLLEI